MFRKRLGAVLAAAMMLVGLGLVGAAPALADRCEPDELVIRIIDPTYESPDDPADPIVCSAMQTIVYDNAACDDTTLMKCLQSLDVVGTFNNVNGRILPGQPLFGVWTTPDGGLCVGFSYQVPFCTDEWLSLS